MWSRGRHDSRARCSAFGRCKQILFPARVEAVAPLIFADGRRFKLEDAAHEGKPRSRAAGSSLSPALRSWIKNCLVPLMVNQYVSDKHLAGGRTSVSESAETVRTPVRCQVQ